MIETLKKFTTDTLFNATSALLEKLNIQFDRETAEPIRFESLWDGTMPQYLKDALQCISKTYFIGIVNDDSLKGVKNATSLDSVAEIVQHGGKYDGMFLFAVEANPDANLTRTVCSTLTRAFNRISSFQPVILFIRQGNMLSMATCERTEYSQAWLQGTGEKLGKVNILRNINCEHPHPGHIRILEFLGDKRYATFDELYKHWLDTFSSELLTKKFYTELSDWYAWVVQLAKFPNNIHTDKDDAKFNNESCIRLITRLIFVWFLKQKHLIPEEFFDEKYIHDNLIENFNPHDRQNILYDAEQSKYYRLILQNLFFAMLNCPIVAEGKTTPNNRRFMKETYQGKNPDYNIKTVMRYQKEFMEGGAEKFVNLANTNVPFLNGGLFDCLDDSSKGLYYDGFSERKESLEQLNLPDYLFFGEEVGDGIDLSQWYGDKKKKKVSARGLIDILKRYCFTIEENTPYDQEVSLDPELLGKVFENLLAAFNPETQTSARKQTGSFYTPREIVQYMVDESLVAHLKRMCGDDQEPLYRSLVSYATEDVELTDQQRTDIMHALYNCRVLDPACGSGAFPMGVLQQMVHVLKRIDPTNKMWNDMMVGLATEEAKRELEKAANSTDAEKEKIEDDKRARLADIESAFNRSINDPDYARKLYLIEHCIYGVDIQPIATQISKLRFFISLVVDQKPTKDAKMNFGIRPLPNLEAKFVTANTLIPLDRSKDLFSSIPEIQEYEQRLQDINHRIFLAKKNKDKEALRQLMISTRMQMAQALENLGAIGSNGYEQLVSWNMFDQNASAPFFDPEWMFGVKGGFDIVIANPPYISALEAKRIFGEALRNQYKSLYSSAVGAYDLYILFIEKGLMCLSKGATLSYITPSKYLSAEYATSLRQLILGKYSLETLSDYSDVRVFENAGVSTVITQIKNKSQVSSIRVNVYKSLNALKYCHTLDKSCLTKLPSNIWGYLLSDSIETFLKIIAASNVLQNYATINACSTAREADAFEGGLVPVYKPNTYKYINNGTINRYVNYWGTKAIRRNNLLTPYLPYACMNSRRQKMFSLPKLIFVKLATCPEVYYDENGEYASANTNMVYDLKGYHYEFLLAYFNSKIYEFIYRTMFGGLSMLGSLQFQAPQIKLSFIPKDFSNKKIENLVKMRSNNLQNTTANFVDRSIDETFYHLYNLTYDEVLAIDPSTPITREEYENFKLE